MLRRFDSRFFSDSRREIIWVAFIILSFVAINFSVATRTPVVWYDEPGYTDPAANFYFGDGFTSTFWGQDRHAFWAGNVPLYQILLVCFFHSFGFGFFQARVVNTLLAALAGGMIWLALKRSEIIRTPYYRLLSLLLILSGSSSTLTIRTIRPDTTMFAVCAAVFLAWTIRSEGIRLAAVFLFSLLLLPAGIPMLPYAVFMLVVVIVILGRRMIRTAACTLAGVLGGIGLLLLFYGWFSSIRTFIDIILPFTVIQSGGPSLGSKLALKFFGDRVDYPDTFFTSFFGNPLELVNQKTLFDYSSCLLFLLILGLGFINRSRLETRERQVFLFALLLVLIVPPGMHMAGHYRSMYRWMTYMPLCVLAPCFVEALFSKSTGVTVRRIVASVFLVAILLGVPLRTVFVLPFWSERSTQPIEACVKSVVSKSDVVIGNHMTYFALRPLAKTVFLVDLPARGRFDMIQDLPKSEVTLLCLKPEEVGAVVRVIGGNWNRVSAGTPEQESALARTRYDVGFYRRADLIQGQ